MLEGKDVGLVGPGATEQGPALRGTSPLVAGWGGTWEQVGHLASFSVALPLGWDEWGLGPNHRQGELVSTGSLHCSAWALPAK